MSKYTIIPQSVSVDNVTIDKNASGEIQIKDGAITNELMADNVVKEYLLYESLTDENLNGKNIIFNETGIKKIKVYWTISAGYLNTIELNNSTSNYNYFKQVLYNNNVTSSSASSQSNFNINNCQVGTNSLGFGTIIGIAINNNLQISIKNTDGYYNKLNFINGFLSGQNEFTQFKIYGGGIATGRITIIGYKN